MSWPSNDSLRAQLSLNGYTGDINDAFVRYLSALYPTKNKEYNELLYYHLGQLGLIGSLQDRIRQWNGTIFSPRVLHASGEQGFWFDPSDFTTLFQDSTGTTPVTAVGQPVGRILDKSGRGNHATQVTSTARPLLQQDATGRYYLSFDGIDDFLVTPSIDLSTTSKITLFAGVRKLSDAAIGEIVDTNYTVGNGKFFLRNGSQLAGGAQWSSGSRGTTAAGITVVATTAASYASPITSVLTHSASILEDINTLRVNGVLAATQTGDQGTGNYSNTPVYLGMRAGTSLPFVGRIYSVNLRGASSTATEITSNETYTNIKTGAY